MISTKLTKGRLDKYVLGLANAICLVDSAMMFIRFGSSLQMLRSNKIDVDILLLKNDKENEEYILHNISELKKKLFSGDSIQGFKTDCPQLELKVQEYIDSHVELLQAKVYPRFIIGPLNNAELAIENIHVPEVYLHFKGPLSHEEFSFFCAHLPFHANSILQQSRVIIGSFPKSYFQKSVKMTKEEFDKFNAGLKKRVDWASSVTEVDKCINKILQNIQAFYGAEAVGDRLQAVNNVQDLVSAKATFYHYFASNHSGLASSHVPL